MSVPLTRNPSAELNLTWVTDPPIFEVSEQEAEQAVKELKANMTGWDEVTVPDVPAPDDIDQRDWKDPKRTQQERWNDRLSATRLMTRNQFSGEKNFVYRVSGQAIGVMAIADYDLPYIQDLVTHPGSEVAGGVLIERAVQVSRDDWGKNGKVELWALDEEARRAYLAVGFESDAKKPQAMILDPSKVPDKWVFVGNRWQIKKYVGKKYVA